MTTHQINDKMNCISCLNFKEIICTKCKGNEYIFCKCLTIHDDDELCCKTCRGNGFIKPDEDAYYVKGYNLEHYVHDKKFFTCDDCNGSGINCNICWLRGYYKCDCENGKIKCTKCF